MLLTEVDDLDALADQLGQDGAVDFIAAFDLNFNVIAHDSRLANLGQLHHFAIQRLGPAGLRG